ncbi:MAG: YqaJ viral recombinase family protein [Gammaproteobacteria bacterium]|nr:MAG: YqaJ viral recombinase family protein [Gammaproteobacteria bacterium]
MNAQIEEVLEMDRRTYIGGSDVAAILGVSPWKSKFALYQQKISEWQDEITPQKERIFARGKRWEPVVMEMLIDELEDRGHEVRVVARNNRIKDIDHDFIAAEIDMELMVDGELINGEMKTVHPFAAKDWGEPGTDEIPIYYTAQVLHGQMVARRSKTVVAALIGADDLRVHFVNRDEEMINIIRNAEVEFWNMVQNRISPDPVTIDDINRLYRIDSGKIIEADTELFTLYTELVHVNEDLKANDAHAETLKSRIKARMGEAALLMHNGQKLVSWKTNKESSKTDWKQAFNFAFSSPEFAQGLGRDEVIKRFTDTKPGARPFLLK